MNKIVVILLLLSVSLCYAQPGQPTGTGSKAQMAARIFAGVTDDTIGTITAPDSVYLQFYDSSSEWKLLTSVISDGDTAMVTADDKVAENTLHFMLARESFWTESPQVRFEFRNTGQDTCTSRWLQIGKYDGAFTLIVKADTVSSRVDYGNSILTGN